MKPRKSAYPTVFLLAALLLAATAVVRAGKTSVADRGHDDSAILLPIPNARIPMSGVLSGGQPTPEQIETAARAGYRTVINLRTDSEPGYEWERQSVEDLGLLYVRIPIAGSKGLTRENVERINAALEAARAEGPVLLHCASGNRIGAVLALRAAWLQDADAEEALRYGMARGMTRLEPATRELLGLEAAE